MHADDRAVDVARPSDATDSRELRDILARSIERLPTSLRLVFTLRDVEEMPTSAVSECLGISRANVKVRLHRARAALSVLIDEEIGVELRRLYQFGGRRCDQVVRAVLAALERDRSRTAGSNADDSPAPERN